MALKLRTAELNERWQNSYRDHEFTRSLFNFVTSLTPRVHSTNSLKGELLVATPDGIYLRRGPSALGPADIALSIGEDVRVCDLLKIIPMPLDCEPLELACFISKTCAAGDPLPADLRELGVGALRSFVKGAADLREATDVAIRKSSALR